MNCPYCWNSVTIAFSRMYEIIQKGVGEIMGGKVLDYEAKRILNEGRAKGRTEGINETVLKNIRSMMQTLKLTAEQAMDALQLTAEDQKNIQRCYDLC